MNTASLKSGDIVQVDKKGRRFHAVLVKRLAIGAALAGGELVIRPLDARISYRQATAREVIGIWHANKQTAARVTESRPSVSDIGNEGVRQNRIA